MEKEELIQAFKEALQDPKKFFEVRTEKGLDGKKGLTCNHEKLNDFFQSFSKHFLDVDVAELTNDFPSVKFGRIKEKELFTVGNHDHVKNEITLNLKMFLKHPNPSMFMLFVSTICHEHQHFKQNLYVDLKNQGKIEESKKIESFIGSESAGSTLEEIQESIEKPSTKTSLGAYTVFMGQTMPEKYKKMRSTDFILNGLLSLAKMTPVEVASYYHDPHEIDARERSIEIFERKFNEVTSSDPNFEKDLKKMVSFLHRYNKLVLDIQPRRVFELYESEKKNIGTTEFIKFAQKIDKEVEKSKIDLAIVKYNGSMSFNHKPSNFELWHESFGYVLEKTLADLSKEEKSKFLEILKNSGSPYAKYIAEKEMLESSADGKKKPNNLESKEVSATEMGA